MQRSHRIIAAVNSTALAFVSSFTHAAIVVSPTANTVLPGNFQGPTPFNYYGSSGSRNQVEYPASSFLALGGPQNITDIKFRPYPGSATSTFTSGTFSVSNVIITLSTTSHGETVNPLSATYADNVGADVKTVYSGPITLTTTATNAPGGATKLFDYDITLQTPFAYNPLAGNLLLDVNIPTGATVSGGGFGFVGFDNVGTVGDGLASITNIQSGSATSGTFGTDGAIAQFTTSAVPEPTSLAALALAGTALLRRRRA